MSENKVEEQAVVQASPITNGTNGGGSPIIPPIAPRVRPILIAILIVAGLAELAYSIVNMSAMPVYIKAIGLDTKWVGIVAAGYLVAEGLLKSPFGLLSDRIGRKPLMVAGPTVSIFTATMTAHTHNPYGLIALRVLDGMGLAALWPAAFSMIGDYVPAAKRASAMSMFNVSYLVGIALGPAIGGMINDIARYRLHFHVVQAKQASFYAAALFFAVTAVVALIALPEGRPVNRDAGGELSHSEGITLRQFKQMLGRMPVLLAMTFTTFLGIGFVMAYAKLFIMELLAITEGDFGKLLLGPALAIALASIPLGTLGDKIGKPLAAKIGIGICTISFWALVLFTSKLSLMVFGSTIGIGFVIAFPALMAQVSEVCEPSQRGAAVGAIGTSQGVGAILGVLVSGFLYNLPARHLLGIAIPHHGVPFVCCALMLALAFMLALVGLKNNPAFPTRKNSPEYPLEK